MKRTVIFFALFAAAGCGSTAVKAVPIQTATIQRRDIIVTAEATGVIEPINVVEVKSKTASGQVMAMPIDIGFFVKPGDLIVQIDTTILHQNYLQNTADFTSAESNLKVAAAQLARQQDLYAKHIITLDVLEQAQTAYASMQATDVRQKANLELGKQALIDARVEATVVGTILTKPVSIGQVIQAGATSVSGGTVIATMADLTKVRARALVAETDIGMVKPGQVTNVTVDAFPDHPFVGKVDHIEPSATVQQNVTMFATLIAMDNAEGLLQPGMNGEVSIVADTRLDVIAVPNDAIRSPREAAQAAALLGLNPDTVKAQMRGPGGGNGGGGGGGGGQGGNGGGNGGGRGGRQVNISNGELAADLLVQGGGQAAGGQGGGQGGRGGPRVQVTDEECKTIDATMKKKPAIAKKIDDIRTKMRDAQGDARKAMMDDMKTAYEKAGVDMMKGGACARRSGGGANGGGAAGGGRGGNRGGANAMAAGGQGGGQAGGAGGAAGGFGQGNGRSRPRTGLVFVQSGATWIAKTVRLGVANYDYTEVTDDGLKEGDKVAMLSAAALQAKRQQQNDQMKNGASPLGGGAPGGGGGGRGPGGGRGN